MWPGPLLIFLYLALTEKSLDTPDLEDRSRRENLLLFNLKEGLEKDSALAFLMEKIPMWFIHLAASPPE